MRPRRGALSAQRRWWVADMFGYLRDIKKLILSGMVEELKPPN